MKNKIRVLFLQSQDRFLPSALIHSLLMHHFDRGRIEVHVACTKDTRGAEPSSLKALETIPEIYLRPTNFGPTISHRPKVEIARSALSSGIPALASMVGLASYIKRRGIDIIHTADKPRDAFYGVLLAKLTGARVIVHLHMPCYDWVGKRVRWAMEQADGIICVSEFVKQTAIANGYDAGKIHTVLSGIEVGLWNDEADGNAVRREFDIPPDVPLLAIVARLVVSKGHEWLLHALARVKVRASVKLLIVGEDDPDLTVVRGGHRYSDALKKTTLALGLGEHVIFTGHRSDMQQILAACDLYAMPAIEEGFGLVFLEAMAMKKPIVALDEGGTPEVVEHGRSGLLSSPEDDSQLVENLLTLLTNSALRRQMGEYGRTRVEHYFNSFRMTDDVERVYRHLLGEAVRSEHR